MKNQLDRLERERETKHDRTGEKTQTFDPTFGLPAQKGQGWWTI